MYTKRNTVSDLERSAVLCLPDVKAIHKRNISIHPTLQPGTNPSIKWPLWP